MKNQQLCETYPLFKTVVRCDFHSFSPSSSFSKKKKKKEKEQMKSMKSYVLKGMHQIQRYPQINLMEANNYTDMNSQ